MSSMRVCKTLMVQGTTSDAGKSTIVAGLCRHFARKKISVAPFKPQNMALNSAVTEDGGEIGRAQALQAQAAFLSPHTDMNPVLIKPSSDIGAQIIIHGKALQDMQAQEFHHYKPIAQKAVLESFERISKQYSHLIVEGAGSPAEINLREGDIANMGFAEAVDCPVILVADIDRGGVFAHLVGTLALLSQSEQDRVIGFVINRFRGDIALLQGGLDWLEDRTGKPVFGVVPYLKNLFIDAEDAICVEQNTDIEDSKQLNIVVPVLPRISNHTDFDALRLHPSVNLQFVAIEQACPPCDLIILPGSKNVRDDLQALLNNGWQSTLDKHLRYGGKVMGICGGLQMLGLEIVDNHGIESSPGESSGFGLLPLRSELHPNKKLSQVSGCLNLTSENSASVNFTGYEIHCGQSMSIQELEQPITCASGSADGFLSADKQIFATYMHGIFDQAEACQHVLEWAGLISKAAVNLGELREQSLNRLADSLETSMDLDRLNSCVDHFYASRVKPCT